MEVQTVTPRVVGEGYIQTLQKTPSGSNKPQAQPTYGTDKPIQKIIKLPRCSFRQAVDYNKSDFHNHESTFFASTDSFGISVGMALDHLLFGMNSVEHTPTELLV